MNNLTQKLDKCRTWWDFRNRIEKDLGYIRFERIPIYSSSIILPKNVNDTWNYSVLLLTELERSIHEYDISQIKLRKITVLDGWRIIPTCPNPFEELPSRNLNEFTSLGFKFCYGVHELWFTVKFCKEEATIDWNIEIGDRLNPYFQNFALIYGIIFLICVSTLSLGFEIIGFVIIFTSIVFFSGFGFKNPREDKSLLIIKACQDAEIKVKKLIKEEFITPTKLPDALPVAVAPSAVVETPVRRRRD